MKEKNNTQRGYGEKVSEDIIVAGTGFMIDLATAIRKLEKQGYIENLVPMYNHFECRSGRYKITPKDFTVDKMVRFENTSDPDDQAILHAISIPRLKLKGLYIDSYGLYHDELSKEMLDKLSRPRPRAGGVTEQKKNQKPERNRDKSLSS